jgi:hypothetical protein
VTLVPLDAAAAAAKSSGPGLWIVLWIIGIVVGLFLYSKSPKIAGMDPKANQGRTMMLISAFLPCFGINIIWVLMGYGYYKAKTRGVSNQTQLSERLGKASFTGPPSPRPTAPSPSAGNPFSEGPPGPRDASPPAPSPGPAPSSDNPFLKE